MTMCNDIKPEIEAYRIAIENLAKNNDSSTFNNSGPDHAAIVLGNIFKNSNHCVNIVAGDFNGIVSDNEYYLNALRNYLNKNKPLNIIFENEPNKDSLALALLRKYMLSASSQITIRRFKMTDGLEQPPVHFTVGDNKMFRLETSKEDCTAMCSFNNIGFSKKLDDFFSTLIQFSSNYTFEN